MIRFDENQLRDYLARNKGISKNKTKSISSGASTPKRVKDVSCHALALARLSKYPALKEGGIVRGKRVQANHEHWEQVQIFDYFERTNIEIYDCLAAIPNGGLRSKKTANELYEEGVKSGYLDITLDLARGKYHGLKLELKHANGGKPSDNQIIWLNRHHKNGYFACLCYGFEQAKNTIEQYFDLATDEAMPELDSIHKWLNKTI